MVVLLDDHRRVRMTTDHIRDLADRTLALSYKDKPADSVMQDMLYDFALSGSYAAMRELLSRFPLDEFNREILTRLLSDSDQSE